MKRNVGDNKVYLAIDVTLKNKKEYIKKHNIENNVLSLTMKNELMVFDWCVLNLIDSIKFTKAEQYQSYLESIRRLILTHKEYNALVKETLHFVYCYMAYKKSLI